MKGPEERLCIPDKKRQDKEDYPAYNDPEDYL
jgi:hypothetical protein